ncbi:IclR family transcriptional regulator [Sphingopyxis sp.]|uniref:IclR family transcriptional regulator n=1 Tax=Sphingopyxis sp. TaxID=1908224 RepID=UPI0035AF9E33
MDSMTAPRTRPSYASQTLAKGLRLLEALVRDGGRSTLSAVAAGIAMPPQTAHRLALTLEAEGYLIRTAKGVYRSAPRLAALARPSEPRPDLAARLRRPLARLAEHFGAYAHAGILEDGMVTYIVKESGEAADLFTAERMQLEAYCSAIGKILLAALPEAGLAAYLAGGPLVALTANTITDAAALRGELAAIRRSAVAYDRHEIRNDLFCIAVPLPPSGKGLVEGAISLSFLGRIPDPDTERRAIRRMRAIARVAADSPSIPA